MNGHLPHLAAAQALPDISPYLTQGRSSGAGVTLLFGDSFIWGLLATGAVLTLGGLVLVLVMNKRIKYFALEFGRSHFTSLLPYLLVGGLMMVLGLGGLWLGWQAQSFSATLDMSGLKERWGNSVTHYTWQDADSASERIKSTEFWISFTQGNQKRRIQFQQRYLGEKLQDRAIAITENCLITGVTRRVP